MPIAWLGAGVLVLLARNAPSLLAHAADPAGAFLDSLASFGAAFATFAVLYYIMVRLLPERLSALFGWAHLACTTLGVCLTLAPDYSRQVSDVPARTLVQAAEAGNVLVLLGIAPFVIVLIRLVIPRRARS